MQDDHLEKLPYVRNCLTDFDEIWHGDASPPESDWSLKIPDF